MKIDVFSFGILLLEIVSGRKAIDVAHSPPSVVDWAAPLLREGKLSMLFDRPKIRWQGSSSRRSLSAACDHTRRCMTEVVQQLKVLSKTVPSRAWNGLSVVNPCSVADVERTMTKPNSSNISRDQSLSSDSRTREDEEPIAKIKSCLLM